MTEDTEPLTLDGVDLVRAPGFESEGVTVEDVSPGINVVHGPNAAGKTTMAEAIQWLLWPEASADRATVLGSFSLNGTDWHIELDGGRVSYQRNGQDTNGPPLPAADHRDRYRLSLHDLLQQDTRNESFAETIERESAGGYDLAAVHDELGYDDTPNTRRKSEVKEAENAVKQWREAQSDVTGLQRERDRLSTLQDDLEEARDATARVDLLDQAIEYVEARDELQATRAERAEFPDVLEHVDGDELKTVDGLEDEIQEWAEKRNAAETERRDARQQLADVELPNEGVPTGRIDQLKKRRDELEGAQDRKRELEAELESVEAARANARHDIPLEADQDELVKFDPVTWKDVSKFARRAESVRAERESRTAIESHFEDATEDWPDSDRATLQRASQSLEQWLATPSPDTTETDDVAYRIALVSSAMLSVAGVALGLLVHPALFVTLLAAAGVFLYGYRNRETTDTGHDPRRPHRESFEGTGVAAPDSWTEDDVHARLVELYDTLAQYEVTEERNQLHKTLVPDQTDLEAKQRSLEETREELRERLGASPDATDVELTVLTKRILDWQEAHDDVVGLQQELESVERQIASLCEQLRTELDPYGYDDVADAAAATEAIRDLERRESRHESAKSTVERTQTMIEEATKKIESLETERDAVFTDLDLESGDRDALRYLCEQVDGYEQTVQDVETARAVAENERSDLEAYAEYDPGLEERTVPELEDEQREAMEVADRYDEIRDDIAEIETKIDQAKRDDAVETAITAKERALKSLRGELEDDCAAMAGDVLVEHVQETTLEAGRPAVFERAREILTTITRGRYRLDLDEDETSFQAFDTAKGKGLALDELSSGTRLQVLLAVRIAFVEQQEQDVQLPLLLDETLANSDDLRADVIIESMIELARAGRQVFYFTAQGDEVAKWLNALEDTDAVDHSVIDLADARDLDRTVQVPDVDEISAQVPEPPRLDGHDHDTYGKELDAPPFHPHRGAETAHLWYVVDDPETLYELLKLGIDRWGQLENLLERGNGALAVDDPDRLEPVRQNAAAFDAFVKAWKVGRGEPVDRQILEDSGAVSDNFIDRVTDLAKSVNGDAERIIEGLRNGEVNRFHSDKTDELETYFEENGYIELTDPLDDDQIRLRMVERLVETGVDRADANDRATALLSRLG
ncbi:AAA family ATPase [Natrialbaceae archaeon A-arb3/5]